MFPWPRDVEAFSEPSTFLLLTQPSSVAWHWAASPCRGKPESGNRDIDSPQALQPPATPEWGFSSTWTPAILTALLLMTLSPYSLTFFQSSFNGCFLG